VAEEPVTSPAMPPSLEVVFSLTPDDMLEATLGRLEAAQAMQRQVAIVRWLGVLLIVLGLIPIAISTLGSLVGGELDAFGLFLGLVIVALGIFYIARARKYAFGRTRKVNEKIFRERWTPALSLPTRLAITEQGVAAASELSSSTVAWAMVVEIQRMDSVLVLWLGPTGIIIPTRAFASAEDVERFAQWAEFWRAKAAGAAAPNADTARLSAR
jgi:hypothetical protein